MKKYLKLFALLLMTAFCTSCKGQNKTDLTENATKLDTKDLIISSYGPNHITRNIIQDKKGNIWAATFGGIFRYDGKFFTNITSNVSSARFFSILEDRKGGFWFGSVGSGAYYYDGNSFKNFTTKEGLAGNSVTCIYEDKTGNIWFGTDGGASCYDGKSLQNFTMKDGLIDHDINSIIEDKTGKFWFGTRGNAYVYSGKTFTTFTHNGKPFTNVRSIIEDKKGNIWLGGADGLWRYDDSIFTNFNQGFVGRIMEDKKGNIWTSSGINSYQGWALSRYDGNSLSDKKPTLTTITNKQMTFGILEDAQGNIWFGDFNGVHYYDGTTITDFVSKEKLKNNVFSQQLK